MEAYTGLIEEEGKLQAPSLKTLDVNLTGTIYSKYKRKPQNVRLQLTTKIMALALKLARYYMTKRKIKGSVVLLGSLSSFFGLPLVSNPHIKVETHGLTQPYYQRDLCVSLRSPNIAVAGICIDWSNRYH